MAWWAIRCVSDGLYVQRGMPVRFGPLETAGVFAPEKRGRGNACLQDGEEWVELDDNGQPIETSRNQAGELSHPNAPLLAKRAAAETLTNILREADSVDPELTVRVGCAGFSRLLAELDHLRRQRDELQASNTKLQQAGLVDTGDMLAGLGADERRVLVVLANRLRRGARAYGALDLATDQRDWEKERGEEVADLLVYTAFDELKRLAREGKA